jgi:recombination protein RecR
MPETLKYLIDAFAKLPGVGEKTAMKLAFHILTKKKELTLELSEKLINVYKNIDVCPTCWALKDVSESVCNYCSNDKRDKNIICVVEEYADLLAIEQTGAYKWLYHILWGSLSPLHGRGPRDLSFDVFSRESVMFQKLSLRQIQTLKERQQPSISVNISRQISAWLASLVALPNAGYIDYVDSLTLMNALKGRQDYTNVIQLL